MVKTLGCQHDFRRVCHLFGISRIIGSNCQSVFIDELCSNCNPSTKNTARIEAGNWTHFEHSMGGKQFLLSTFGEKKATRQCINRFANVVVESCLLLSFIYPFILLSCSSWGPWLGRCGSSSGSRWRRRGGNPLCCAERSKRGERRCGLEFGKLGTKTVQLRPRSIWVAVKSKAVFSFLFLPCVHS